MAEGFINMQLEMSTRGSINMTSSMAMAVFVLSTETSTLVFGSGIVSTVEGSTTSTNPKPSLVNSGTASLCPMRKYSPK